LLCDCEMSIILGPVRQTEPSKIQSPLCSVRGTDRNCGKIASFSLAEA